VFSLPHHITIAATRTEAIATPLHAWTDPTPLAAGAGAGADTGGGVVGIAGVGVGVVLGVGVGVGVAVGVGVGAAGVGAGVGGFTGTGVGGVATGDGGGAGGVVGTGPPATGAGAGDWAAAWRENTPSRTKVASKATDLAILDPLKGVDRSLLRGKILRPFKCNACSGSSRRRVDKARELVHNMGTLALITSRGNAGISRGIILFLKVSE
jgi:hypothetical protein